jgi:hypothetical protein
LMVDTARFSRTNLIIDSAEVKMSNSNIMKMQRQRVARRDKLRKGAGRQVCRDGPCTDKSNGC